MALIPKFTIDVASDFKSFTFTETTGVYNVGTNPGGYGAPNITTGDVTSAVLVVYNVFTGVTYDDISISVSSTEVPTEFTLVDDFLIDGVAAYEADDIFVDGKYTFTFKVVDDPTIYSNYVAKLITPELMCKLVTLATDISSDSCVGCNKKKVDSFLEVFALYKSLYAASVCLSNSKVQTAYDYIDELLVNVNCNC